ncbi:hypothetical protein KV34_06620 [Klebsiella aerogenes]|nr:hypothetical protein KV34_06620 [Klebsiella aerogenes]
MEQHSYPGRVKTSQSLRIQAHICVLGIKCRGEPKLHCNTDGSHFGADVYSIYGKWMADNNANQMAIMNANFGGDAPLMPQASNQ